MKTKKKKESAGAVWPSWPAPSGSITWFVAPTTMNGKRHHIGTDGLVQWPNHPPQPHRVAAISFANGMWHWHVGVRLGPRQTGPDFMHGQALLLGTARYAVRDAYATLVRSSRL